MDSIHIKNAGIYDPAQSLNGDVRDLYLAEGRVSEPIQNPSTVIDAEGRPTLAGGIDPYCLLASPGQALARFTLGLPSPETIGRDYARMGYTHVHQPFLTLLTARSVRRALALFPFVDTSACVLADLRDMGQSVKGNATDDFVGLARALIDLSGTIGLFLPYPHLRYRQRHYIQKNLSPKKVLTFLAGLEDPDIFPVTLWGMPGLMEMDIPVPRSVHVTRLAAALDSEKAVDGARAFLNAGGSADLGLHAGRPEWSLFCQRDAPSAARLSIDAGLPDPLLYAHQTLPLDAEGTAFAWSLLADADPAWRLSLSGSGPTGGQYANLPTVQTWLLPGMGRPPEIEAALQATTLDLYVLARHTRLEPARFLRLENAGHLQVGARANVAIYDLPGGTDPVETHAALSDCWCLIKDGVRIREAGAFTGNRPDTHILGWKTKGALDSWTSSDAIENCTLRHENLRVPGCTVGQAT